jgi:hypothetical protein
MWCLHPNRCNIGHNKDNIHLSDFENDEHRITTGSNEPLLQPVAQRWAGPKKNMDSGVQISMTVKCGSDYKGGKKITRRGKINHALYYGTQSLRDGD